MNNHEKHKALDHTYSKRMEELYYSKTDEKKILSNLLKHILAGKIFENALDIGPGPGYISSPIVESSKKITMVEPLIGYEETLKSKFPNAKIVIDSIEKYSLDETYDLILMSHMLYYLDENKWLPICMKLYDNLPTGGCLIIVMMGDKGDWWRIVSKYWDELRDYIRFEYIPASHFKQSLSGLAKTTSHEFDYEVVLDNEDMLIGCIGKDVLQLDNENIIGKYKEDFRAWSNKLTRRGNKIIFRANCEVIVLEK